MINGLSDEENKIIEKLWARYHDGGLKDLPPQVYFDMGWLYGLILKLTDHQSPMVFHTDERD